MRELNKLNTFVRVAEHLSFTKAARDLRMTPSAVSKHVLELEAKLGFALLNRSTHGVALTEVGETLFKRCSNVLGLLDSAVTDARNLQRAPHGTLRIHAAKGYAHWILAPLLPVFLRRYPDLRVELSTEAPATGHVEAGFDIAVSAKALPDTGLVRRDIGVVPYVVCASPEYFRAHGTPKRPRDLQNHNCLVSTCFAPKEWPFKASPRNNVVRVKGTFCSDNAAVLSQLALAGIGIVRLPRYTVEEELASGRLQTIFEGATLSRQTMHVYYSASKNLPAKTTLFVDFLRSAVTPAAS
jgi:DNA-binding transcriptional LysR family regulator